MKKYLKLKETRKGFFEIVSEYFRYNSEKEVTDRKVTSFGTLGKNIIAKRILAAVEETAKNFPKAKSPIRDSKQFGKCICFNNKGDRCFLLASDDASRNLIQYIADSLIISTTE